MEENIGFDVGSRVWKHGDIDELKKNLCMETQQKFVAIMQMA